jgi:ribonuclease-3
MPDFSSYAKKLELNFTNLDLFVEALTHRSYLNENRGVTNAHNERLEFLGDAVLELAVTHFLFLKFPNQNEGDLTSYRAALVNTFSLAGIAEKIGLNGMLLLSKGEAKDTGRARQIILANAFEAVLGAIYLDQGYDAVEAFLAKNLYSQIDEVIENRAWQDAKSHFQEVAQEKKNMTPNYKTIKEVGPDHNKSFVVGVYLGEDEIAQGKGLSKQEAEQDAAQKALTKTGW